MKQTDSGLLGQAATRRGVLVGCGAAGVACLVSACGGGGGDGGNGTTQFPVTLAASDVPVGSGTVIAASSVVVTQPTQGQYKAFSAVCTHESCLVTTITATSIICECHGSEFSSTDGSVERGPARQPLPEYTVKLSGSTLTVTA
jgi:Rieske Fe-S protein